MDPQILTWIAITLVLSAFFSGIEIAYLASNKLRIELKRQKGITSAKILMFFIKNPSHFLTTTLIGNNLALIMYGVYSSIVIQYELEKYTIITHEHNFVMFLLQTLISSIIVLVLAEFIPKALFRQNPNKILTILSYPFLLFYYILYPLVRLIDFLARFLLKNIFQVRITQAAPVYSRHDLVHYVSESRPADKEEEAEMDTQIFKNAIEFHELKVRECMIPRTEVIAIEVEDTIETLKHKFTDSGHSKVVVYRNSIDNVIGYVHLVDLYKNPQSIDKIVMPIIIATESMPASDLMRTLIEKRRSMAIVVDEFGGTAGIITIEDIIEEIIGEIEDEHDVDDTVEKKISEYEYIFSARLDIDYINDKYGIKLPEGDYDTLGGLILFVNQNIPQKDEIISLPPFEFTVMSVEQTRIQEVRIKCLGKIEE
jgi:putative hemolysin